MAKHMAEIRSNILINAGFHYQSRNRWQNSRAVANVPSEKKLRVTKNHTQRISKHIINSFLETGIGVGVFPANENELGDQKSAELHSSVWDNIKSDQNWEKKSSQFVHDFVVCGEAYAEIIFDSTKGDVVEQEPILNEFGQVLGYNPIKSGSVEISRVFAFNVLTDPQGKSFEECRHVIVKKLFPTKDLKKRFKDDERVSKFIDDSTDTLQIFDGLTGTYSESKNHTQVNCYYFRPCAMYPNGYYYYATSTGIIESGQLYRFPIVFVGYDEVPTSARAYSFIKQTKPYQTEINRCASKIIEESVTLGSSYILSQEGSRIKNKSIGNGMRNLSYTGIEPKVISGRSGEQYVDYMNAMINEMYTIADVAEFDKEKPGYASDTYSMLFRSLKQKKKFQIYGEKIEIFFKECVELSLDLAQAYYPDKLVVQMVGKPEAVNIAEFKASNKLRRKIKVEPRSEDFTSTLGRSLSINTLLQYAGSNLSSEQIGMIAKYMPFLNKEQMIDEFTLKTDLATNTILALDRGENPIFVDSHHSYLIDKLSARMVRSDFFMLDPQIQQMYQQRLVQHRQALVQQQQQAEMAKQGFVPTTGGFVGVDLYEEREDGKQKRVRLPGDAVKWLVDKLSGQGSQIEAIEDLPIDQQAALGAQIQQQIPQGMPAGMPVNMPM